MHAAFTLYSAYVSKLKEINIGHDQLNLTFKLSALASAQFSSEVWSHGVGQSGWHHIMLCRLVGMCLC